MDKYIRQKDLIDSLLMAKYFDKDPNLKPLIDKLKVTEAVPVVRAKWEDEGVITLEGAKVRYGRCSNCKTWGYIDKYCGRCGARMNL